MKKVKLISRIFGIWLVLVVIATMLGGLSASVRKAEASPPTIYVPDNYPTIQAAVDAASPGDTIIVRDGTYSENVDVNKSLTIRSENGASFTTINAAWVYDRIFDIMADGVSVSGFTITGVRGQNGFDIAPIFVYAVQHCNISENHISGGGPYSYYYTSCGILLHQTSNSTFSNNVISGFECDAIRGEGCDYNNISNNVITGMGFNGICLFYSDGNIINNNTVSNGRGIELKGSANNNVIINNTLSNSGSYGISIECDGVNYIKSNICDSHQWGIYLDGCHNQIIIGNTCSNNEWGIVLTWGSSENLVAENILSNNDYGIWLGSQYASNNEIYLNNFINNNQSVFSTESSTNAWSSTSEIVYVYNSQTFTNQLGNFWSDYSGSDANGDGIGDAPYGIGSDEDNYPLISPFGNYEIINCPPIRPNNSLPCDGAMTMDLTPTLQSSFFFDLNTGDTHAASRWQITAIAGNYSNPVFDTGADGSKLTSATVPAGILSYNTIYYWHVRYQDNHSAWSSWSADTSFTAPLEVTTATQTGNATFTADSGTIENLMAINENALPSEAAEGEPNLLFAHAFFSFNITGLASGATVTVTIELPIAVPVGAQYWKYGPTPDNPTDHWYQLPMGDDDGDNVITITLVDGGLGDDDLTANGVIVDPGGPGNSPGSSLGGCFIATAAYGTPVAKDVQILREFRDKYLLANPLGQAFVNLYYNISPPIANFITDHPRLKPIVRAGLLPAVVMSTVAVNTTATEKMVIWGLLAVVSVAVAVWVIRRRGRDPEYSQG